MNKLTRMTLVTCTVLAIATTSSAPAYATTPNASVPGATASWLNHKYLAATDTSADGRSALAELRRGTSGAISEVINSKGNGWLVEDQEAVTEGSTIYIRAGVDDLSAGTGAVWGAWVKVTA